MHPTAWQKKEIDFKTKGIHLLDLPLNQKIVFLDSFDYVFVCCDGVLWLYYNLIPLAGYAIVLFKTIGKGVYFLANNSLQLEEDVIAKLKTFGVENVKHKPALDLNLENIQSFRVCKREKISAVLMDVNINLSIKELIRGNQLLEEPKCLLIVGANNRLIQLTDKLSTVGPGGFAKLLEGSNGKDAILFGEGFNLATEVIEQFSIKNPNRCLLIAESLDRDLSFAKRCGFQSLLIVSNPSDYDEMRKMRPHDLPNFTLNKLSEFVEFMADLF